MIEETNGMLCFYCGQTIAFANWNRAIRMAVKQYAHEECYDEALNAAIGAREEP